MIPMKYAFNDMKSAARPRNDTTKLRALATGLRLITTAAPKITVSNAKIQNRNGDIILLSNFGFRISNLRAHFFSFHFNTRRALRLDLFVILNEVKDLAQADRSR